jgi:hypothetical protein
MLPANCEIASPGKIPELNQDSFSGIATKRPRKGPWRAHSPSYRRRLFVRQCWCAVSSRLSVISAEPHLLATRQVGLLASSDIFGQVRPKPLSAGANLGDALGNRLVNEIKPQAPRRQIVPNCEEPVPLGVVASSGAGASRDVRSRLHS